MGITPEQEFVLRTQLAILTGKCFQPDMRVTLVARHPENEDRFLILGDDDPRAVAKLLLKEYPPLTKRDELLLQALARKPDVEEPGRAGSPLED